MSIDQLDAAENDMLNVKLSVVHKFRVPELPKTFFKFLAKDVSGKTISVVMFDDKKVFSTNLKMAAAFCGCSRKNSKIEYSFQHEFEWLGHLCARDKTERHL